MVAEVKLTYEEIECTARVLEMADLQEIMRMHGGSQLWRVAVKCNDRYICSHGELAFAWGGTLEDARKKLIKNIIIGRDIHAKTRRAYSKALKLINEQKGAE